MKSNYPPGVSGNEPQITGATPFDRRPQAPNYGVKHERRAEISRVTDTHTYVLDDTGATHILTKGSIDATPHPEGTKGVIRYITGPSYGLWFFHADENP